MAAEIEEPARRTPVVLGAGAEGGRCGAKLRSAGSPPPQEGAGTVSTEVQYTVDRR
jgi:hypothetical protein